MMMSIELYSVHTLAVISSKEIGTLLAWQFLKCSLVKCICYFLLINKVSYAGIGLQKNRDRCFINSILQLYFEHAHSFMPKNALYGL